jgi:serine/threonine protein phosphatase PrpC
MEDAAIAELDIGNGNSIFGVFDGHGGTPALTQVYRYQSLFKKYLSPS